MALIDVEEGVVVYVGRGRAGAGQMGKERKPRSSCGEDCGMNCFFAKSQLGKDPACLGKRNSRVERVQASAELAYGG